MCVLGAKAERNKGAQVYVYVEFGQEQEREGEDSAPWWSSER